MKRMLSTGNQMKTDFVLLNTFHNDRRHEQLNIATCTHGWRDENFDVGDLAAQRGWAKCELMVNFENTCLAICQPKTKCS